MKLSLKYVTVIFYVSIALFTSCRKEDIEFIGTPPNETLEPNSMLVHLMKRTATNDGSKDNILDLANCFTIKFPISVEANNISIEVGNESDYSRVESVFDEDYTDVNQLNIAFPITIITTDYSEETIANMDELLAKASTCNGENVWDDDIECVDFIYPFSASKFNTSNEMIATETFTNDKELYNFIESLVADDITTINFPISLQLADDSITEISTISELQTVITNEQNACDEDDDYDYDDDDCDHCTQELLEEFLVGCQDWYTDKVRGNAINYNTIYDGYDFNFFIDGTVEVYWNSTSASGTWSTSGTGNNMFVLINIPGLSLCNNNWKLQEINTNELTKIDLIVNTEDRLRYRNTCN